MAFVRVQRPLSSPSHGRRRGARERAGRQRLKCATSTDVRCGASGEVDVTDQTGPGFVGPRSIEVLAGGRRRSRLTLARHRKLSVRVSEEEQQEVAAAAAGAGVSVGAYMADAALAAARGMGFPVADTERNTVRILIQLQTQLGGIGNKLTYPGRDPGAGPVDPQVVAAAAAAHRLFLQIGGVLAALRSGPSPRRSG